MIALYLKTQNKYRPSLAKNGRFENFLSFNRRKKFLTAPILDLRFSYSSKRLTDCHVVSNYKK